METITEQMKMNTSNDAPTAKDLKELPKREIVLKSKENKSFNLAIIQGKDDIIFIAKKVEDIKSIQYKKSSPLKDFHNANKFFRQFDSTEELFSQFINYLKDEEFNISLDENKIKLVITEQLRNTKIELTYVLEPEEAKIENIVYNVCNQIDLLKEENKDQKEIISKLEKENDQQKK